VFGPIFECGALCWDRYLSVDRLFGYIFECGAVSLNEN